jgi:Pretoxin HINT domain
MGITIPFWVHEHCRKNEGTRNPRLQRMKTNGYTLAKRDRGKHCFPSSALVRTPRGYEMICKLNTGDSVICYDELSGAFAAREVTRRIDYPAAILWDIHMVGLPVPVATTASHPFLTTSGWKCAIQLSPGDQLIAFDERGGFKHETVLSVENTDRRQAVYNLHTAGDHTYIVDGLIVHNFVYFRTFRTHWHRLFIDPPQKAATRHAA